jgi:uncharacterized protein (TIGR02646 family)
MIKLIKGDEPEYLSLRAATWLSALNDAIANYGQYNAIPEKEKESLIAHYRHESVKSVLFPTSYQKCAFCECIPDDGGNFVQVEHFYPKSQYPQFCFTWDNFLPCCGKCNLAKGSLDTLNTPIINPYKDEPSEHIYILLLRVKSKPDSVIGQNSIKELNLNSNRLIKARRNLLAEIEIIFEKIASKIDEVDNASTPRRKENRLFELSEFIDELDELMHPSHAYSFFCREIILSEPEYMQAKAYF